MNKLLLLFLLALLIPLGYSNNVENYTIYNAGSSFVLHTIPVCDGPVEIRVSTELKELTREELSIQNCRQKTTTLWECECKDNFVISVDTTETTNNKYHFTIKYYLKHINYAITDNREPGVDKIIHDSYIREYRIRDVFVIPKEQPKQIFNINIEQQNAILFAVLVVILIIVIIFFRFKKSFGSEKSHDVLNYRTNFDEDDSLNNIK